MDKQRIEFFVRGIPKPGGSKRVFINKKSGKPIVTDDSAKPGKDWRHDVKCAAHDAYPGAPLDSPLALSLIFRVPRPQSHFGSGLNASIIRKTAPKYPTTRPDVTKLIRSVEDALTGLLWRDDALIVAQAARKVYCDDLNPHPGVLVIVEVWE